jgi:hypothetical protein
LHLKPDHLKDLLGLVLNLFENIHYLPYTDLNPKKRFSFLGSFWSNPHVKEKRLFALLSNLNKRYYNTAGAIFSGMHAPIFLLSPAQPMAFSLV